MTFEELFNLNRQTPTGKLFQNGGDTRTFQQYDRSNAAAKRQIGSSNIGVLMPNNPYRKEAESNVLKAVLGYYDDPTNAMLPSGAIAGTFAGMGAKTANLAKLERAREMLKGLDRGSDAWKAADRAAWKETGWTHAFPDGKPRFEIDDSGAIPGHRLYTPEQYDAVLNGGSALVQRQKALLHPDLSAAYPETKRIGVILRQDTNGGSFAPVTNIVHSSAGVNGAANRSTTLHELQHAIQEREGFARGGSPSVMSWASSEQRPELLKVAQQTMDEWKPATYEQFWGGEVTKEGEKAYKQYLKDFASKEQEAIRWRAAQEGAPGRIYKNLAGEVESRLTQSRMDLTPAQRMEQYPIDYFDVPVDQQIVRYGNLPSGGLMAPASF